MVTMPEWPAGRWAFQTAGKWNKASGRKGPTPCGSPRWPAKEMRRDWTHVQTVDGLTPVFALCPLGSGVSECDSDALDSDEVYGCV